MLYNIKNKWENQTYYLAERLEDVARSVSYVPYCKLCGRLM